MADQKVTRRLAAIFAADMVGYSRLIEADEEGTIARQKIHRTELIDPKIAEHDGRIVKLMGDGMLVEFASVVDAVRCAVEVQRSMREREAGVPKDRRIAYRIGVNIGDIVIDGDDILGDGVNIAARLEAIAEPGGICVSRNVYDQVKNKTDLEFADLELQNVKNIAEPVPTYRVVLESDVSPTTITAKLTASKRGMRAAVAVVAGLAVVAGALAWWQPWTRKIEPARVAKMAHPLPKRPSIIVLPFDNLSGNKNQDHVADGFSENIIQTLAKVPKLFVIARNSAFTYKGRAVKVQRVAEEMGVHYVLEGSIQSSGDRIRVTAQLVNALTGRHIWSDRYDRKRADLFAVQDAITKKIVTALEVQLSEGEQARIRYRSTSNFQAWSYAVQAVAHSRRFTKTGTVRARELARQALALDRKYAYAWTIIAWSHFTDARHGYTASRKKSFGLAVDAAKRALQLGPEEPDAHWLMSTIHLLRRNYDKAAASARKAVELGPNMSSVNGGASGVLRYLGEWDEAIALGERAVRLSPRAPWWVYYTLGNVYALNRHYSRAIATQQSALRRAKSDVSRSFSHWQLAFSHAEANRTEKARQHMAKALKFNQRLSAAFLRRYFRYKDPAHSERIIAVLLKAGLPEK